ncbi:MAG: aspartate--tRNA(Asn) ligase [Candidatus Heimdallarchaeota archaeon]
MIYGVHPNWRKNSTQDVTSSNDAEKVLVSGWVQQIRDKGSLVFLTIRDAKGICQVTLHKKKITAQVWEDCQTLTLESVVSIEGQVKKDPRSQLGAELIPSNILIHSLASHKFPIDLTKKKTKMDLDTIFRYRELSIRDPDVVAVMEIKHLIAQATREFFTGKGFIEIFTPLILATSTEGGAEQFNLDYYGVPAVLAQSCQFYKQAALACHEKVFGIIPSWRAEKFHTPRHLAEFWQVENEIAFATDVEIMNVQEDYIISVLEHVVSKGAPQLERMGRQISIPSKPFKRVPFAEAKNILTELGVEEEPDEDFGAPGEQALSKAFNDPFFIIDFPSKIRGLYYARNPTDPAITRSIDLIAPEGFGELSSGGQRVSNHETLRARISQKGFDEADFAWYLRMFEYGMPPHAGFGLGFERLVRWITNVSHIRETSMFPRTPELYQP